MDIIEQIKKNKSNICSLEKAFKVNKHISDYITPLEDRHFYTKSSYTIQKPRGLYANIDSSNSKRVIQDLGRVIYTPQSTNNDFTLFWDLYDIHDIVVDGSYGDVVVLHNNRVVGKTITVIINPLDKNVTIEDIPPDQLADLKPNEVNIIYIQYLGEFLKQHLGLGASGTVNLYNIQIKQPIIV